MWRGRSRGGVGDRELADTGFRVPLTPHPHLRPYSRRGGRVCKPTQRCCGSESMLKRNVTTPTGSALSGPSPSSGKARMSRYPAYPDLSGNVNVDLPPRERGAELSPPPGRTRAGVVEVSPCRGGAEGTTSAAEGLAPRSARQRR